MTLIQVVTALNDMALGGNLKTRKTVLIIEKENLIGKKIEPWLKKQGFYTFKIERADVIVPLIDSKDRIYTIVLVDDNPDAGFLDANLKILKRLGRNVPIIVSTDNNEAAKEKTIRESSVFYYHMESAGEDELIDAIKCALNAALEQDHFMPFLPEG